MYYTKGASINIIMTIDYVEERKTRKQSKKPQIQTDIYTLHPGKEIIINVDTPHSRIDFSNNKEFSKLWFHLV